MFSIFKLTNNFFKYAIKYKKKQSLQNDTIGKFEI
jgi:hypothetical protein